jgi:hypothetical protein
MVCARDENSNIFFRKFTVWIDGSQQIAISQSVTLLANFGFSAIINP